MRDVQELRREANASRVQFINTELDLALTFASVAAAGLDEEKTALNWHYARKAYKNATSLLAGKDLSPTEHANVETKMRRIKTALESMDSRAA